MLLQSLELNKLLTEEVISEIQQKSKDIVPTHTRTKLEKYISAILQKDVDIKSFSKKQRYLYYGQCKNCEVEIEIFEGQYSDIKTSISKFSQSKNINEPMLIRKNLEYKSFGASLILITYQPLNCRISLYQFINHLIEVGCELPIDALMEIIIHLITIRNSLHRSGLEISCFDIRQIYLYWQTQTSLENQGGIYLYIDLLSFDVMNSPISLLGKSISANSFGFGIGEILFMGFYNKNIEEVSKVNLENADFYTSGTERYFPGIGKLINKVVRENDKDEIFKDCAKLRTWMRIFNMDFYNGKLSSSVLFGSFITKNTNIIQQSISVLEKNLDLVEKFKELWVSKNVHEHILLYLSTYHCQSSATAFFVLKMIRKLKSFKCFFTSAYSIPMLYMTFRHNYDLNNEKLRAELILVLKDILKYKTNTVAFMLYHSQIFQRLIRLYPDEAGFLIHYTPYLGEISVDVIKNLRKYYKFQDYFQPLALLQEIPVHFKLQSTFDLINTIEIFFSIEISVDFLMAYSVFMSFNLILELLKESKEAKYSNKVGKCYRNPYNFRVSPIMARCETCKENTNLCIPCSIKHELEGHTINYVTNSLISDFACASTDWGFDSLVHETQKISPRYSKLIIPHDETTNLGYLRTSNSNRSSPQTSLYTSLSDFNTFLDGDFVNSQWVFTSEPVSFLTLEELDVIFYREVIFTMLYNENLIIKIIGTGISINNTNCFIRNNSQILGKMPKIGTGDTLGIGFTSDRHVFFTYNGFNLLKYYKFVASTVSIEITIPYYPEPSVVQSPEFSLYVGDGLIYLEKDMALRYEKTFSTYCKVLKKVKRQKKTGKERGKSIYDVVYLIKNEFEDSLTKIFHSKHKSKLKKCCIF